MNKVICDVCGTAYPETEPRCPICDCVKSDGGQTSAGNTGEDGGYTYVKGGRFSKANVRKRLKANQQNPDYVPAAQVSAQMPALLPEDEPDEPMDEDEEGFDEEELESVSNTGLIIIVILLVLAIIAVGGYIYIKYLQPTEEKVYTQSPTTSSTIEDPGDQDPDPDKSCTGLNVSEEPVALTVEGERADLKTAFKPVPEDTTDECSFTSNDESIVRVDQNGIVTAVSAGETTVTVKCGEFEAEIVISCVFDTEGPGDDPVENPDDDPVEDPDDDPVENPDENVTYTLKVNDKIPKWKVNGKDNTADVSLILNGSAYQASCKLAIVDEDGNVMDVTWEISKASVVEYNAETGKFVAKDLGQATLTATYGDTEFEVLIRVTNG